MAECIELEKAISAIRRCKISGKNLDGHEMSFNDGLFEAIITIGKIPKADVRPERYSHWHEYLTYVFMGRFSKDGEPIYQDRKTFMCVKCGRGSAIKENFCPSCGAKMDGKDGESDG